MEFVRHNQTLTTILLKIKDDVKCDYETALAWALSAKNSLSNNNGYRPTQLLLGKNPNLPNFIENNLPAQEPSTKSFHIATRLTALHAARKAFIESESSNKLKTALRKNTRSFFIHVILVMKYSTSVTIHLSGRAQEKFWVKTGQFCSSDKVYDI